MTQHWYAVYTRPNREKRVASLLTKKGIENYCPINYIVAAKASIRKPVTAPLFNSFIFVFISENQMSLLRNIPDIVNFMYWKSKPALINDEEINVVRKLTQNYINIKLEKISVCINDIMLVTDEPPNNFDAQKALVASKYQTVKVTLPSLGYTMFAEREKIDKESIGSDFGPLRLMPNRFNALFSN